MSITYRRVDRLANEIAWQLKQSGVSSGDHIGVMAQLSAGAVTAMIGVLKAGCVYVPLDADYPTDRLTGMCEQVGIRIIVADRTTRDFQFGTLVRTPRADHKGRNRPPVVTEPSAGDPAYIMFTSGTTGRPKAVSVPHRAVTRLVVGSDQLDVGPTDTWLATTSLSFDVSCFEVFGALLNGARLVLLNRRTLLAPDALAARIETEGATVMVLSAGLFHERVSWRPGMFASLRYLFVTADVVNASAVRSVRQHGPPQHLINAYGPTENGIFCTMHEITELDDDADTVPIGRPAANSTAYVVRPDSTLTAIGEAGELWVGGDGLALGYHADTELTHAQFVDNPFPAAAGARLYRTGDRACWRADGTLDFLGRTDRQIKLNGYRIELADVENALVSQHETSEAVADVRTTPAGRRQLVAWAVPSAESGWRQATPADRTVFAHRLRAFATDRLPAFMVPSTVHIMDKLPRNANGKIDRALLPTARADVPVGAAPATKTERAVAEVWTDLLALPAIGRDDDFFAMGGQSLLAARAVATLQHRLVLPAERSTPLIQLMLSAPTVREFSRSIDAIAAGQRKADVPIDFPAESRLDPTLDFSRTLPGDPLTPRQVLLTGANGFLGAFLLDRLLHSTSATVHCLVRASDQEHATRRLHASMRRYGLAADVCWQRVIGVPGDLTQPRLGLPAKDFDTLARNLDTVIHNAAHVNFIYPYEALRLANVDGTQTLLQLATINRLKSLHYVSTIDTLAKGKSGRQREDQLHPCPSDLQTGYAQTKWVSESLLRQAAERGLPVTIYRPCEISGSTSQGLWPTDTLLCALIKATADSGAAPDGPLPLDLVPVDYAAHAVVHILTHSPPRGATHHLTNVRPADFRLLIERLRARGRTISEVPYAAWLDMMRRRAVQVPDFPLTPFLPMFTEAAEDAAACAPRTVSYAQHRDNFEAAMKNSAFDCPPVEASLIDHYLDHFEAIGFLGTVKRSV